MVWIILIFVGGVDIRDGGGGGDMAFHVSPKVRTQYDTGIKAGWDCGLLSLFFGAMVGSTTIPAGSSP